MGCGPESMAYASKQTARATVRRRERERLQWVPGVKGRGGCAPFDWTPCPETKSAARTRAAWRPQAASRSARPSARTRAPARTPANAGRRRTRRRSRRAGQSTIRLRGVYPSGTSRILQVKIRGLSPVPGRASSVGILTATRKATLVVRSAFACHAQTDAREGEGGRLGAAVQRFACPAREGDRYKGDSLVPPTRSLAALGMTNGCLGMTNGRLGVMGYHRG